ncbi:MULTISPECIES: glycosyltransferase [unclassified Microbacterium]|uniref:glycosyltransferase n=1 Tax=unclassified Microbacterium TaxID=2609290 RepID=UPI00214D061D|nr:MULTISPECIES: glycosyltransferase [unclassified Microbacterium]MCR2784957.1 glycosyltransferase [Microbacterium sp. zg.B96]WIM16496.1 glycosyltransferase [Microbacterium sp. zg-B96]
MVQPYVPDYRVPFFELLIDALRTDDIALRVVCSEPTGSQAARGDAARPPWVTTRPARTLRLGRRSIVLTYTRKVWAKADAVIVPLMGSSLDANVAVFLQRRRKVGVWGHIAPYTAPPNPVDAFIERQLIRGSDEVFAYTPSGAAYAIDHGADPAAVTTVMNSIDTRSLASALDRVSTADIEAFRTRLQLNSRTVAAYIGGLDESKRIDLLESALDDLWEIDPGICVVIGGTGDAASRLSRAEARGQVRLLGRVDVEQKALLLRSASVIVNPGRVGLIAVDALVSGRPLVTADWPYHAPEIEYLNEGDSVFRVPGNPSALARVIADVSSQETFDGAAGTRWDYPSLEAMVEHFADGVRRMLQSDSAPIASSGPRIGA